MNSQIAYRIFPDVNDLRRAGLLFGTPESSARSGPELFEFNASADPTPAASHGVPGDRRRNGEINEVQFGVDAMRHGYICGKPYTNEAFDLFVVPRDFARLPVAGKGKRSKRIAVAPVALVQVRSTAKELLLNGVKTPYYRVSTQHTFGSPYKAGEIDFFTVYIEPLTIWYIIPYAEVGGRAGIFLFPNDPRSTGQYEKFKEKWELLRM